MMTGPIPTRARLAEAPMTAGVALYLIGSAVTRLGTGTVVVAIGPVAYLIFPALIAAGVLILAGLLWPNQFIGRAIEQGGHLLGIAAFGAIIVAYTFGLPPHEAVMMAAATLGIVVGMAGRAWQIRRVNAAVVMAERARADPDGGDA